MGINILVLYIIYNMYNIFRISELLNLRYFTKTFFIFIIYTFDYLVMCVYIKGYLTITKKSLI